MKAMILAAGHGKRMQNLTQNTPKPLLKVDGKTLLENKIEMLKRAGINEVVINVAYLPDKIKKFAGDGRQWDVEIVYSEEDSALETAGGILKALTLLGDQAFLAINADIWTDYPLQQLSDPSFLKSFSQQDCLGHLVMVKNPSEHSKGDFKLDDQNLLLTKEKEETGLTFSGVAIYKPELFTSYPNNRECFPLLEVFQYAIDSKRLSGEYYQGQWDDVGTPDRLQSINSRVTSGQATVTLTGVAANDE